MGGRTESSEDKAIKKLNKKPEPGLIGMLDDLEKKHNKIKIKIKKAEKLFQKTGNEAPLLAAEKEEERLSSQYFKDRSLMDEYPKDYQKARSFRSDRSGGSIKSYARGGGVRKTRG